MRVKLSIPKVLYRDYLNALFQRESDGSFLVSRECDFGKLICSRVRYSNLPVSQDLPDDSTVVLILPKSRPLATAPGHYLYFTKEDQAKLQDALEALFNIDFDGYYLRGKKLEMQQKEIIEAFIVTRNLLCLVGNAEMLKKRQYRDGLDNRKKLLEVLIARAYYRHERIDRGDFSNNSLISA